MDSLSCTGSVVRRRGDLQGSPASSPVELKF